ncbi:polymerase delta-interacting protein 2 [Nymphon striatum]|nr:polymerase delta-interacting protein 2 [Nymphon striatum]
MNLVGQTMYNPEAANQMNVSYRLSYNLLAEVGKLSSPKAEGLYQTGQLFLHKVFGYRGVTLFSWASKIYDRDVCQSETKKDEGNPLGNEVKSFAGNFYQVLIDSRDCPFVRTQTESVTFLGSQDNSRSLYAIPGLDYVSHEDVIPYTTVDKAPIYHDLFEKFFEYYPQNDSPFIANETLKVWQEKSSAWLELSNVHKETTENIRVTVIPFYMGCRWRYCIRLENLGNVTVQLKERYWRIFSLAGTLETVRGRGVIGHEPILSKSQPAYQYSSHVSLQSPSGHMWGTFKMERNDGYTFDCRIPPFSLESKSTPTPSPSTMPQAEGEP